jgi:hypothetical protein
MAGTPPLGYYPYPTQTPQCHHSNNAQHQHSIAPYHYPPPSPTPATNNPPQQQPPPSSPPPSTQPAPTIHQPAPPVHDPYIITPNVELPLFFVENAQTWVEECELIFTLIGIPNEDKVKWANAQIRGKAKTWLSSSILNIYLFNWQQFC